MDMTYRVSKNAYIELLADMVRRNDSRPLKLLTAFLLTFGQMAAVAVLCVTRLEGSTRLFAIVWSLLLAGITLLRRKTVRQRAKGTLQRLEYAGQLPEDYWREHKLRTAGKELRVSYGDQRLSCPLHAVGPVEERPDALYIYCGGTIFDIIPAEAFKNAEAMRRFARDLRAAAKNAEMPAEATDAVPTAAADITWEMDEKHFLDGQFLAFRTLYYRYRFVRRATFIRLAASVAAVINLMANRTPLSIAAVINLMANRTPLSIAASVIILLLANLENISMIPALSRLRIRKELGSWEGSAEFRLSVQKDTLLFASDQSAVAIPKEKINLCEKIGPYYIIAWSSFPAVILPEAQAAEPQTAALLRQIENSRENAR